MISERMLIAGHTSFWHDTVPYCDTFIHDLNIMHRQTYCSEIKSLLEKNRRGFINEFGFRLYNLARQQQIPLYKLMKDESQTNRIRQECEIYISRFTGIKPVRIQTAQQKSELYEAIKIAGNLTSFYTRYYPGKENIFYPILDGCGFLSQCEGDLLVDDTLFEIKSGDRLFRSLDIRQLLLYSALDWVSKKHEFGQVGLLNPRNGVYFLMKIDNLCMRTAATGKDEVFSRIISYLAGGGISK